MSDGSLKILKITRLDNRRAIVVAQNEKHAYELMQVEDPGRIWSEKTAQCEFLSYSAKSQLEPHVILYR